MSRLGALGTPQKPELHCSTFWFTPKSCVHVTSLVHAQRLAASTATRNTMAVPIFLGGHMAIKPLQRDTERQTSYAEIVVGSLIDTASGCMHVSGQGNSSRPEAMVMGCNGESVTYQEKICKAAVVQANHLWGWTCPTSCQSYMWTNVVHEVHPSIFQPLDSNPLACLQRVFYATIWDANCLHLPMASRPFQVRSGSQFVPVTMRSRPRRIVITMNL